MSIHPDCLLRKKKTKKKHIPSKEKAHKNNIKQTDIYKTLRIKLCFL